MTSNQDMFDNDGASGSKTGRRSLSDAFINNKKAYKGVSLSESCTPEAMAAIENMEVREDDIILATYPRSGTHWMIEIITLIQNHGKRIISEERLNNMTRVLDFPTPAPFGNGKAGYELAPTMRSPRFFWTHLPIQFLPAQIWEKKPRIITVSRDPRDVLTSSYKFFSQDSNPLRFDRLFNLFLSANVTWSPWWTHQHGYWEHRNEDNFLFLRYADLKKDRAGCVAQVSAHLGYDLSDVQLSDVVKYSSLAEMKATYAFIEQEMGPDGKILTLCGGVIPVFYKGVVGGWKSLFTVAQSERFQKHHEAQLMKFDDGFCV